MITTAVYVAAGLGSRLKERTDTIPKGFLEVGGTPLMLRSIDLLRKQGIKNIIIGTGYHSEFYEELAEKNNDITCVKSPIFKETSSFYTLYNLRESVHESFLLLESDLIFEERAITALIKDDNENLVLASGATNSEDEVYIQSDSNKQIKNMSKKKDELDHISGELVGISKVGFDQFQKLCTLAEADNKLLMKGDYETAFVALSQTSPFYMKKIEDLIWAEIDCEEHLERVNKKILPKLEN